MRDKQCVATAAHGRRVAALPVYSRVQSIDDAIPAVPPLQVGLAAVRRRSSRPRVNVLALAPVIALPAASIPSMVFPSMKQPSCARCRERCREPSSLMLEYG